MTEILLDVLTQARGRGLLDAADDLDKVAGKSDKAGDSLRDMGKSSSFLDSEIVRLRGHITELGAEIDRTGDKSLLRTISRDRSQLKQLEALRRDMDNNNRLSLLSTVEAAADAGAKAGLSFVGAFVDGAKAVPAEIKTVLIGSAVTAVGVLTPVIGGGIAGAIAGGVGVGGIVGGVMAASSDPRVQAAADRFATSFKNRFSAAGATFVDPIIQSLDTLDHTAADLHLDRTFAKLAPWVDDLTRGLSQAAERAWPGFNKAVDAAGPALGVLAGELPEIAGAFGDMVGDIAASEGALDGLRAISGITIGVLQATGWTVKTLSDTYHSLLEQRRAMREAFGAENLVMGMIAGSTGRATTATRDYTQSLEALNTTIQTSIGLALSMDRANIGWEQSLDDLSAAVEHNGTTLSIHSAEGRANRTAILNSVDAAERQREAAIASGKGIDTANQAYQRAIDKLIALAEKAGFSKTELKKLVDGRYQIVIDTKYTQTGQPPGGAGSWADFARSMGGHAVGTLNAPAGWSWVGENGPELRRLRGGDQILTNTQSMAMMGAAGSGQIVGYLVIRHEYPDAARNHEELLAFKRNSGLTSLGLA